MPLETTNTHAVLNSKFKEVTEKLVLVYFGAEWCRVCKQISPLMIEMKTNFPDMVVLKVDADEGEELFDIFNIDKLPTFVFVRNSLILHKLMGSNFEKLKEEISKYYTFDVSTLTEKPITYSQFYEEALKRIEERKKRIQSQFETVAILGPTDSKVPSNTLIIIKETTNYKEESITEVVETVENDPGELNQTQPKTDISQPKPGTSQSNPEITQKKP